MRADRLVAIVLLLQVHRKLTAAELADRLETSERTIRRDLEALMVAGVPVYPQRGRYGGWALVGGHRIDLTGLTAGEAQALFLVTGAGSAAALGPGVAEGLAAARRKLLAALPEPLRDKVGAAAGAVLVDPSGWGPAAQEVRDGTTGEAAAVRAGAEQADLRLAALRGAVLDGLQVVICYEPPGRPAEERRVHPHGLVDKRGVWYLIASAPAGLRTYRLSRLRSVAVTAEPAERPAGFDLAAAWADVQRRLARRPSLPVAAEVAVAPAALRRVRATIGAWWPFEVPAAGVDPQDAAGAAPQAEDGQVVVRIRFPSATVAAAELAPLGELAEVLAPEEVRAELAELGRRLARRYGGA